MTKETEIPNSAKEARTVIVSIYTPEQFKIHILISIVSVAVEKSQCFSLRSRRRKQQQQHWRSEWLEGRESTLMNSGGLVMP